MVGSQQIVLFSATDASLLEQAWRIRETVFVQEQQVPSSLERDETDRSAWHVLVFRAGNPVATGRMFAAATDPTLIRIGRMAVLKSSRGQGLGAEMLAFLVQKARTMGFQTAILNAQKHAMEFYEKAGFTVAGLEFMEAGIRHVPMTMSLACAEREDAT